MAKKISSWTLPKVSSSCLGRLKVKFQDFITCYCVRMGQDPYSQIFTILSDFVFIRL